MDRPIGYRIQVRVGGELHPAWSMVFGDVALRTEPDGTTVIGGDLGDQSAVHGLLDAIRDLGLSLVSVEVAAISVPSTDTGRASGPPDTGPTALGSAGEKGSP
jgi:hypothetical protein